MDDRLQTVRREGDDLQYLLELRRSGGLSSSELKFLDLLGFSGSDQRGGLSDLEAAIDFAFPERTLQGERGSILRRHVASGYVEVALVVLRSWLRHDRKVHARLEDSLMRAASYVAEGSAPAGFAQEELSGLRALLASPLSTRLCVGVTAVQVLWESLDAPPGILSHSLDQMTSFLTEEKAYKLFIAGVVAACVHRGAALDD